MTTAILNTGATAPDAVPAPAGHDEAMIARFDKAQEGTTETPQPNMSNEQRPEWLPEKFKSPEELARAYDELSRKLGQPKAAEQPVEKQAAEATPDQAKEAVEAKGLDYSAFSAEFSQTGSLSDESYAKLETAGIPRDVVDAYVAGQRSIADGVRNEVLSSVGGEKSYTDITQWASQNMDRAEVDAYNRVVQSGDKAQVMLAAQGLKARYEAANGSEPKLVSGNTTNPSAAAFRSTAEITAAMRDPRYRTDSAYRADVEQRLVNSNIF